MSDRSHIAILLLEAREKRGLSREAAATECGVPLRYVQLLEGETLTTGVPDEFYLIPFFRKYAAFVGLEVEKLLPEFLGQVQHVPSDPSPSIAMGSHPPFAFSLDNLWKPAATVLAVALATFLMMRTSHEPDASTAGSAEDVAHASQPADVRARAVPEVPAPATRDDGPTEADRTASAVPAPAAHDIRPPDVNRAPSSLPAPEQQADANDIRLVSADIATHAEEPDPEVRELRVVARETVWLEVGRDDGPKEEFMLSPGDTHVWTASDSFSLKVGNAGGLSLELDGAALPPLGASGQVVRVRLPEPPVLATDG